jgi:rubredoxin
MTAPYRTWQCSTCGYIFDESAGAPLEGIPAGTRWEDVPADWLCPMCGTKKSDFEMVEI